MCPELPHLSHQWNQVHDCRRELVSGYPKLEVLDRALCLNRLISRDILGRLIDGKGRSGHLNVDSCQKDAGICADEEDELSSQTRTHTNVVYGGIGAKPELHNNKHVLCWKHRDLLQLKHDGAL